ncbi:MAG: porin [Wolbachia sp.]
MRILIALLLLFFVKESADARVILDKEIFYAELDGKIDLRFGYAFNRDSFSSTKDKTSSYSDLRLLYLQQVYPNTQMGFNVKIGVSDIANLRALDIEKLEIEKWYFIIKNQEFGSFEYGKGSLVSQNMLINTSKIYTAAGGVNGHWINYANLCGNEKKKDNDLGCNKDKIFWIKPSIYSDYNGLELKLKQSTINYISPEIYNFQLGFSYVPGKNNLQYNNLIATGLSYKNGLLDEINFTTALTGEFARENLTNCSDGASGNYECRNQLLHWNFCLKLKFFDLDCIFSYGNGGKFGEKRTPETNNMHYINAGIAYHFDSHKLSLTYFRSSRDIAGKSTNELTSRALSIEYPLAVGTSYYLDIVKFSTKESEVKDNNSGYVLLAGLKLSF